MTVASDVNLHPHGWARLPRYVITAVAWTAASPQDVRDHRPTACPDESFCPQAFLGLVFIIVFGYYKAIPGYLFSFVEQAVTADLEDLTVSELQAHALDLQRASGRLAGRATQVLAAVHARSGGQVLESSLL